MTPRLFRSFSLIGGIGAMLLVATQIGQTHTPIRSKYTYNDDVFPILRSRCASCHVPDGVAPMSLMTYKDAVPWAESLRMELISGHMPPWYAELGFGELKNPHTLSGRELDVLLVWSSGGTPRGDSTMALPAIKLTNDWALGPPDLALPMPAPFTLGADTLEDTKEFVIATATTADRWIRAVDVLPGTPAIVRQAVVSISAPAAAAAVLATWLPGSEPVTTTGGTGFRLPAGATLTLRMHYKKTWKYEGTTMTDRSTVGLYFAETPSDRAIQTFAVTSGEVPPQGPDHTLTFSKVLTRDVDALALRSHTDQANVTLQVEAVRPNGERVPLIRLTGRPNWDRRYWFDRPMMLARGTTIEVVATFQEPLDPAHTMTATGTAAPAATAPRTGPLRITLDVVPSGTKRSSAERQ